VEGRKRVSRRTNSFLKGEATFDPDAIPYLLHPVSIFLPHPRGRACILNIHLDHVKRLVEREALGFEEVADAFFIHIQHSFQHSFLSLNFHLFSDTQRKMGGRMVIRIDVVDVS